MGTKRTKNSIENVTPAVICTVCSKEIAEKQPRCSDGQEGVMHIHHKATSSTAPTQAKANRPCKMCVAEGVAEPSRDTYFTVGTRKDPTGARKQLMVNTYICQPHIQGIEWYSGPRYVGRAPEPVSEPPKKSRTRTPKAKAEVIATVK